MSKSAPRNKHARDIRLEIVEHTLPHVPFDGWSWQAVITGAQDAGYNEKVVRAIFPDSLPGVLAALSEKADRDMLYALSGINPETLRVRDRIKTAVLKRFEGLSPYRDAVRQSVTFWMLPHRKPKAAKIVWRTADEIWRWAGDRSTDYNFYTKRTLLSGILISSTLAWLDGQGQDEAQLEPFLERRIEDVMKIGKLTGKLKSFRPFPFARPQQEGQ